MQASYALEQQTAAAQREAAIQDFGTRLRNAGAAMQASNPPPPPRQTMVCTSAGNTTTCN
jgi:hypothetical protein